jgi:hypothetical protein
LVLFELNSKQEKEMKLSFNKYAQFPNIPGIIIVRNKQGQHLFTMYTDNIRARIESVDSDHIKGTYGGTQAPWSQCRIDVAAAAGLLVWEYIEMPNTDRSTRKTIAEALDAESLSKNS